MKKENEKRKTKRAKAKEKEKKRNKKSEARKKRTAIGHPIDVHVGHVCLLEDTRSDCVGISPRAIVEGLEPLAEHVIGVDVPAGCLLHGDRLGEKRHVLDLGVRFDEHEAQLVSPLH